MRIYIGHASSFNYVDELYTPIKKDEIYRKDEFILPHEDKNYLHDVDFYRHFDLAICEISYPSTGLGIEMAFFYQEHIPIYCLAKDANYSKSVLALTKNIIIYQDKDDMLNKIKQIIEGKKNET